MDLQEVMDDAVEEPLDIDLQFASEAKSVESDGGADLGELTVPAGRPLYCLLGRLSRRIL